MRKIVFSIAFSLLIASAQGQDTDLFLGEWQQLGYSKVLVEDYSELKGRNSASDFVWVVQNNTRMIMKNDVYDQNATYKLESGKLVITHTGFDIDFELIELTSDRLIVKDFLDSYLYYQKSSNL